MTSFTIFGKGAMGTAIANLVMEGGATVEHIDTSSDGTNVDGDIVVLAVPYPALGDIAAKYGDQLAGRIVVDITNPLDFDTFDSLVVPADSSATAELAAALPSSRVLKAFNTTFAATLESHSVGSNKTTVLIAGDDTEAKRLLSDAVTASNVGAVDAGPLKRARELESLGFLQLTLAAAEKIQWSSGFALVL